MTETLLRLRFIPYNARLIDARKEKGWTQKEMSWLIGLSTGQLGHIETLRTIPSEYAMSEISAALDLSREYLFPESLLEAQREGLFDHRVAQLEEQQIVRLTEARRTRLLPPHITDEEMIAEAERALLKERIAEVIDLLKPREKLVIELRFGLKDGISRTLEQVGKLPEFNVTKDRIRQIEVVALRKLRHPSRSRKLKDFL